VQKEGIYIDFVYISSGSCMHDIFKFKNMRRDKRKVRYSLKLE